MAKTVLGWKSKVRR